MGLGSGLAFGLGGTDNSAPAAAERAENTLPSVHFLIYVLEQDIF